jgi:hypothetical protein
MSPNRVVAVATPLLFAPLAGAISVWLAEHFPGFNVPQSQLEQIFIAGALIALAPAAQWLHGWQKYEARNADLVRDLAVEPKPVRVELTAGESDGQAGLEGLDDFEDLESLEDLDDLENLEDLEDLDELEDDLLAEDEEPAGVGI